MPGSRKPSVSELRVRTVLGCGRGARAIDLLHVAGALILESELFLTTDGRQAQLAKAAGLKVVFVE